MKIVHKNIGEITPYENNPRKNDKAVEFVANSIEQFGFRQPIVVDADGVIIAGHTRLKAAVKLGMAQVPVHVVSDLTDEQAKALRIADNKSGEVASWDMASLSIELAELAELGYDAEMMGFTMQEVNQIHVDGSPIDPCDLPVPEPPDDPVTQRGDLWVLGDHRLLCGDSSSAADVDRLLDGAPIDLVNTDPPYNVKVEPRSQNAIAAGLSSHQAARKGKGDCAAVNEAQRDGAILNNQRFDVMRHGGSVKASGKMRAKDRPLVNDFMSDEAFDEILLAWFGNIARVLKPGGSFYIWGGYANLGNYPPPLAASGLYFSQGVVWDKQHPVLTRKDFMGAFEICFYGWREGAGHKFFGPNNATDLWHLKKVNPQSMVHLTEKPVELAVLAIQYSSCSGDRVLDLFGGSGSTLIGCEQTGRHAYLMEIDPAYCDVILRRWSMFADRQPVLDGTGKTLAEMKEVRHG